MSSPATCPVLALPTEITAEIFLRCMPDPRGPYLFDQPHAYTYDRAKGYAVGYRPGIRGDIWVRPPPQLTLIKVCRLWRDIALGTPALWAELRLNDTRGGYRSVAVLAGAAAWLARAGDCPLTVSIRSHSYDDAPFLELLQRHSSMMRAVDLELLTHKFENMLKTGPWGFPMLRTLSLWRYDADYTDLPAVPIPVFVPLLRELFMSQWRPGVEIIGIPWNQLTDLTASHYSIDDCLSVLRGTPNLVQCRLSVFSRHGNPIGRWGSAGPHTRAVTLPHLRALTIYKNVGNEGEEAGSADILDFLTLPALHTLRIFDNAQNALVLNELLAHSTPPLHTLAIHQYRRKSDIPGGTRLAVSALAMLPTLARLEIWRPTREFAATLFEDVFARGGERALLPRLHTLALWGCSLNVAELTEQGIFHVEEDNFERKEWAKGFGGALAIEEALLKLKSLASDGLEVIVEDKRRA
ncbi:hypothetical protein B0H15DRAFT_170283 [Mycena belliarum]|uniref:F-box domain-containing protein n=1 Tax=Mycena belliarum TaxID=1033014 RepID=A0AAD6U7G6_9AGAR|nr:hypothetical protein B0H15DRAFT_170283 [Mycena belliae]